MQVTYLLRLLSAGRGALQGRSKDPNWPGWIPLQSFGSQHLNITTGFSAGVSARGEDGTAFLGGEYYFLANLQDLDFNTLQKWSLDGEPVSGKLNALPAVIGEEGYQLIFDGARVSHFSLIATTLEFSLEFDSMERRYLIRYR